MRTKHIAAGLAALLIVCSLLHGCLASGSSKTVVSPNAGLTVKGEVSAPEPSTPEAQGEPQETLPKPLVSHGEVALVAKVLRGECYDDEPDDKREVARVICNRASDGRFGESIEEIVTAPYQFAGYSEDNEPTRSDFVIAREVLTAWYTGGCKPLGKYLYFSSGAGHTNVFREDY